MPRKTDSKNPADWLWIAEDELDMIGPALAREISFIACRSKLAEVLEKVLKAELIRLGWPLEKTHDLEVLLEALSARNPAFAAAAEPLCTVLNEVYFTHRYPGFDLDDPDWPALHAQVEQVLGCSMLCKRVCPKNERDRSRAHERRHANPRPREARRPTGGG